LASSMTRRLSSTTRTPLLVRPACAFTLSTTRCRSAYAATCGRCVTTITWCDLASLASRRPTSTPARPPTPAPPSSKTRGGPGSGAGRPHGEAQHPRGRPAAGGPFGPGRRGGAGVGAQPQLHLVAAVRPRLDQLPLDDQRRRIYPRGGAVRNRRRIHP